MQDRLLSILEEYKQVKPIYEEYTQKMYELINSLIKESEIKIHSVDSRTKGIDNLEEKLWRKRDSYKKLSDITDLSGIRIICYFSSQVEEIAKIIEHNFAVIPNLSIDKGKTLDPDRFGYLSLHYVARISDTRKNLQEYKKYQDLLCEIQIRSILQHSWAEIEHDLGYKSTFEIPRDMKRRFYRLSSLLELADDEFINLKAEIETYSTSIKNQNIGYNEEIYIDAVSLNEYVSTSPVVKKLDTIITDLFSYELVDRPLSQGDFKRLLYFDIKKISELNTILEKNKDEIIFFAKELANLPRASDSEDNKFDGFNEVGKGITLFYLCYVLIGKKDVPKILEYLNAMTIGADRGDLANDVLNICNKYHENLKK